MVDSLPDESATVAAAELPADAKFGALLAASLALGGTVLGGWLPGCGNPAEGTCGL